MTTLEEMAQSLGLQLATDLRNYPFVQNRVQKLPYPFAKKRGLLPLAETEGALLVATADPYDLEALDEVRCHTGLEVKEVLASKAAIDAAIELCYQQTENVASELIATYASESAKHESVQEGDDLLEESKGSPVIQILNAIIKEAIGQRASDIHFEPSEGGLAVRYRIDGVLKMRHAPPREYQAQLLTRIKVMAKLDIAEHRLPQDGRIKLNLGGRQIDFRVSTVPIANGERIVLRILDKSNVLLGVEKIGMQQEVLKAFRRLIRFSEGIVLVTGPTGSGKTTTLYSALSEISSEEVNIMTVEDPIEYKLQGIAQIGVNPKINLTFARGLRAILRQDPDVIMIGEIRDCETAEIAIQSALTGHLVLSTLHTNDAPSALTRLVDMGVEPYLLSSTVIGVLAQRLVRTICPQCKEAYLPEKGELEEVGLEEGDLPEGTLYRGKGCAHCFDTGYKGRYGIYELMPITHDIKRTLLTSPDASRLKDVARHNGMLSLREAGGVAAAQGITTVSEVLRVTRGIEDNATL